jgi:hypothetical protein
MKDQNNHKPGPLFRALAVLGGGLIFVLIASVIHPGSSDATNLIRPLPTSETSLGSLVSDDYTIEFIASSPNTLYSVRNAEGALLLENATAEELYQLDPEKLDINRLVATQMSDVDTNSFE